MPNGLSRLDLCYTLCAGGEQVLGPEASNGHSAPSSRRAGCRNARRARAASCPRGSAEDSCRGADAGGDQRVWGRVRPGMVSNLWLVIGDTREIGLAKVDRARTFEYRLSLLARRDDLVTFGGEPHPDFERYRSHFIGTGPVLTLNLPSGAGSPLLPLAARCRLDDKAFSRIVE